jgi:hypothetical protein
MRSIAANIQLENKITGRESQGACRKDELIGSKPPVEKLTLTLDCLSSGGEGMKNPYSLWLLARAAVKGSGCLSSCTLGPTEQKRSLSCLHEDEIELTSKRLWFGIKSEDNGQVQVSSLKHEE